MGAVLLRGAQVVVTMDDARREVTGADVLWRRGVIDSVGVGLAAEDATVTDARGCVVTPGLINTHHHLFQTLTRGVPGGQDALLFGWLTTLYPIWARYTPDHVHVSALVGLAELALSGCTLSSDHLYLFPNGARLDDSIAAPFPPPPPAPRARPRQAPPAPPCAGRRGRGSGVRSGLAPGPSAPPLRIAPV